jgi:hypothetical protein
MRSCRLARCVSRVSLLLVFALIGCPGGGCKGTPPGDPPTTPKGKVREEMFKEGRKVIPEAQDDLPVRFEPIEINKKEDKDGTPYYSANLSWKAAEGQKALASWLQQRVAAQRPELPRGRLVPTFTVLLAYKDKDGNPCGRDTLSLDSSADSGRVELPDLGEDGSPVSATAQPGASTWVEADVTVSFLPGQAVQGKLTGKNLLTPQAPANLPLRFTDINVDPKDVTPAALNWSLVSNDWQTFYTLLERATEKNPAVKGRKTRSMKVIVTYRDRRGPLGTENISLDLTKAQGSVRLTNLNKRAGVVGLSLEPVSLAWQGRQISVPLHRKPKAGETETSAGEATAVKAVEKLGGKVTVDAGRPGKPIVGVDFSRTQVTDAALKELKELKHLQTLDLGGTVVTDAGLKELKELKSLQKLNLTDTKVTDAGVKELKAARPELEIRRADEAEKKQPEKP